MSDVTALRVAVDLMLIPSRVRSLRTGPLPHGVPFLLRIAANDEEATREAIVLTGKSPETLRAAAAFFIEQILLRPGADSYHILGRGAGRDGVSIASKSRAAPSMAAPGR